MAHVQGRTLDDREDDQALPQKARSRRSPEVPPRACFRWLYLPTPARRQAHQSVTEVLLPAIRVMKADVTITVSAEEDDISPEESYDIPGIKRSTRDAEGFVDAVDEMIEKHGLWGWCQVTVTVRLGPLEGESHMGGCSYESDDDFFQNS